MKNIDPNTVTIVIAVAAFLSPIATAAINVWLQLRLKKLELNDRIRRDTIAYNRNVYERYLCSAGKYAKGRLNTDYAAYGEAYALAYAYSPEQVKAHMLCLDQAMAANNTAMVDSLLPEVASLIADTVNRPNDNI